VPADTSSGAGGHHQHALPRDDRQLAEAQRGRQPQRRRGDRLARAQHRRTHGHVLTGPPDVLARAGRGADLHRLGAGIGRLHRDDRVGPGRQRAPVMIRCVVPGARVSWIGAARRMSAATGNRTGWSASAPATSSARTA
jgi:hypothetical protein